MGYDRGRRRGRDKRSGFGEDSFDPFGGNSPGFGGAENRGNDNRGQDRFGATTRYSGSNRSGEGAPREGGFNRMPPQVVGTGKGTVKFFNAQKGFGFIQQEGGGDDVFVHISAVERAGLEGLAEGQGLAYNLVDRGGKLSAQDLQIEGELIKAPVRDAAPKRELTGEKAVGTVKFFNTEKGFGFIQRDDGQPDAFVHITAIERSGLPGVQEGERYEFELEVDRRGKYSAVNLVRASD